MEEQEVLLERLFQRELTEEERRQSAKFQRQRQNITRWRIGLEKGGVVDFPTQKLLNHLKEAEENKMVAQGWLDTEEIKLQHLQLKLEAAKKSGQDAETFRKQIKALKKSVRSVQCVLDETCVDESVFSDALKLLQRAAAATEEEFDWDKWKDDEAPAAEFDPVVSGALDVSRKQRTKPFVFPPRQKTSSKEEFPICFVLARVCNVWEKKVQLFCSAPNTVGQPTCGAVLCVVALPPEIKVRAEQLVLLWKTDLDAALVLDLETGQPVNLDSSLANADPAFDRGRTLFAASSLPFLDRQSKVTRAQIETVRVLTDPKDPSQGTVFVSLGNQPSLRWEPLMFRTAAGSLQPV